MTLKSTFFRQHTLLLPRCWLVVLLLLITGMLGFLAGKDLANYLALTDPVHGRYLVVEGWLDESELDQALQVFRHSNNRYEYLLTTGGPDKRFSNVGNSSYAEKSAKYFLSKGLAKQQLIVIPTPESAQARTFLSAVMVRDWFAQNHLGSRVAIDVFSASVHARRTHLLYETAFHPSIDIGVYASIPLGFKLPAWWQTSAGAKLVVLELISLIWTVCFFEPGEPASYQEKIGRASCRERV